MDLYNATTIQEYFIQYAVCFTLIIFLDKMFAPKAARWFFLHIWINLIVVITGFSDVWFCLSKPNECFTNQWLSTIPYVIGVSGHIYHVIAFSNVKTDDYIHHILMVPIAGGLVHAFLRNPGTNLILFGITGLPGGLDYVLLTLAKTGYIDPIIEKRCNVIIQVWMRMPILLFGVSLLYPQIINGSVSIWASAAGLLVVWNAIHYMHDTIFNFYTKHYEVK